MVGKSTFGRSLTGRSRYAITPKTMIPRMMSVVATGRRMNSAAKFMTASVHAGRRRHRWLEAHLRARHEAQLAVGHHGLARLEPARNHRLCVHRAGHGHI